MLDVKAYELALKHKQSEIHKAARQKIRKQLKSLSINDFLVDTDDPYSLVLVTKRHFRLTDDSLCKALKVLDLTTEAQSDLRVFPYAGIDRAFTDGIRMNAGRVFNDDINEYSRIGARRINIGSLVLPKSLILSVTLTEPETKRLVPCVFIIRQSKQYGHTVQSFRLRDGGNGKKVIYLDTVFSIIQHPASPHVLSERLWSFKRQSAQESDALHKSGFCAVTGLAQRLLVNNQQDSAY